MKIIGREKELKFLQKIYNSRAAEFIAVYGRRRVGKTFLVREFFSKKGLYFELTGLKDGPMTAQLENFIKALSKTFYPELSLKVPKNWREAFDLLASAIDALPKSKKITLFLDELPWLATKRSGLIQALDYAWNTRLSRFPNVKLIVCGSAASWMLEHLINAKGGLYNRLTHTLFLEPFTLKETKAFFEANSIKLNPLQTLNIYMIMGGIPHYLNQVERGKSATQNIDRICFAKDGLLRKEFPRLFKSLFDASDVHYALVREIAKHRYGLSRDELLSRLRISSGGTINKKLGELEAAGFIQGFVPYGKKKKNQFFKVIDEYTIFYLHWIEPTLNKGGLFLTKSYWESKAQSPSFKSWAGYAFESVCFKHVDTIRRALSLDKTSLEMGTWRYIPRKGSRDPGAQIDLLFDRDDGSVDICEIKFHKGKFTIDKEYAKNLMTKMDLFEEQMKRPKQIFLNLVTSEGVKPNSWSKDLVDNQITLKSFFS